MSNGGNASPRGRERPVGMETTGPLARARPHLGSGRQAGSPADAVRRHDAVGRQEPRQGISQRAWREGSRDSRRVGPPKDLAEPWRDEESPASPRAPSVRAAQATAPSRRRPSRQKAATDRGPTSAPSSGPLGPPSDEERRHREPAGRRSTSRRPSDCPRPAGAARVSARCTSGSPVFFGARMVP